MLYNCCLGPDEVSIGFPPLPIPFPHWFLCYIDFDIKRTSLVCRLKSGKLEGQIICTQFCFAGPEETNKKDVLSRGPAVGHRKKPGPYGLSSIWILLYATLHAQNLWKFNNMLL